MDRKKEDDLLLASLNVKSHVGDRKAKKFFRITIPLLVIEVIAIIGLSVYLILLPKNYCKISVNVPDCVVYVNKQKTNKFRMENPKKDSNYYYYGVDVSVELPGEDNYELTYVIKCKKYQIVATTSANRENDVYTMNAVGGEKTQILTGLTIISSEDVKNFDISVVITAEKL